MKTLYTLFFLVISQFVFSQTTVTIECDKDNTMYSESGALSNATGENLFAGVTSGTNKRRSLIHFSLASIPAGANVTAVTLSLTCNNVAPQSGSAGINVFKVLSDWGEATSGNNPQGMGSPATTNDATWSHRFFGNTTWNTAGGDFIGEASGGAAISQTGAVNISNEGLIADAQAWVNNPAVNFGWIVTGNSEGTSSTARRFASRNNATQSVRPKITITYTNPLPVSLKSFTASLQTNKVLLSWKTASESNNSHFNVEQSNDGRNFKLVGSVPGAGNSSIEKSYSFVHSSVNEGTNYYRLCQVDFDGSKKYSSIVSVNISTGLNLRIQTNPVQSTLKLQSANSIIGRQFYISNTAGKVVQKGIMTNDAIYVGALANGIYFLNVEGEAGKLGSTRFVKQ